MLVIHPEDRTTAMLSKLYSGLDGVRHIGKSASNAEVRHILNHTSSDELIMMLGHGSDQGLFSRVDDTEGCFDRIIIGHSHAYYLHHHPGRLVGIWCNADLFARKEGLHGLFSGMIITEMDEARMYGIKTSPEELSVENDRLADNLREMFDQKIPLCDIPQQMLKADNVHSQLTEFNYRNFYYL